jgi:hypothetical protein
MVNYNFHNIFLFMTLILTRLSVLSWCFHNTANFCTMIPFLKILCVHLSFSPPDRCYSKIGTHDLFGFVSRTKHNASCIMYYVNKCWAALFSVGNEVVHTLKILNIHLHLVHHKFKLIKIQVVVPVVAMIS